MEAKAVFGAVEQGVAPPRRANGVWATRLYPLKAGESFVVAGIGRMAIYSAARRLGVKVKVKAEGNGWRVWRADVETGSEPAQEAQA